jgi:serine/threonine protein kinase
MIGQTINNYILERKIGEGGMSEVFLARHNRIDRVVAVKKLHKNLFANELVRNRFKNEANALIKLEHRNIVKIHDYIEQEDFACLIVEYIDGITLDEYINKYSGPLPDSKASDIICNVLDAVQYAHDNNILHRDIKPGNIMVRKDGTMVKVMDFGIAKFTGIAAPNVTHINAQLGTPYYMSPEQVKGVAYSALSDIYSLGVTLYEMATGKCPYIGVATLFELHSKIVNEPLPPTSLYYPDVSSKMQEAIKIATNKIPEERFKTCNQFKEFLRPESIHSITKEPVKRKSKAIYWATFTLLVLAGAVIFFFIMKNNLDSNGGSEKKAGPSITDNKITNTPVAPKQGSLVFLQKADSMITEREINTHTAIADSIKKNELKEYLSRALSNRSEQNVIDSIFKSNEQYFLAQQISPGVPVPPTLSQIKRDLAINKLSNGSPFSENAEIKNYRPVKTSERFTASFSFKPVNNDTTYNITVLYKKEGDRYKYVSGRYAIKSVPAPPNVIAAIYPEKNQVIADLKNRYLNKRPIFCNTVIPNMDEVTGYTVANPEEYEELSTISYRVSFSINGIPCRCQVTYRKNSKTDRYEYKKTDPSCD